MPDPAVTSCAAACSATSGFCDGVSILATRGFDGLGASVLVGVSGFARRLRRRGLAPTARQPGRRRPSADAALTDPVLLRRRVSLKATPKGIRTHEGFGHRGDARSTGGWPKSSQGGWIQIRQGGPLAVF